MDCIDILDKGLTFAKKHGMSYTVGLCFVAGAGYFLIKGTPKIIGHVSSLLYKKKLIPVETKAKLEIQNNKADNDIRKMKVQSELEERRMRLKEELRSQRESEKKRTGNYSFDNPAIQSVEIPLSYNEIMHKTPNLAEQDLRVFIPYFHWFENLGIVGCNHGGKSTFVRQLCRSFALGYQEVPLFPNWTNASPVTVLLFALEHNDNHFKVYDANQNVSIPNWHIKSGATSIDEIKACIVKTADIATNGLVVVIDNYSKLSELGGRSEIRNLAKWMDNFKQQCYEGHKRIAYINVYHTIKQYAPVNPITFQDVRGDAGFTMFSQEFISFTPCKRGCNYRMIKILKNKYIEQPDKVIIVRYANSPVQMFEFAGKALESEELPKIGTASSNEIAHTQGTKHRYSDEEILEMYNDVKNKKITWKESEEKYGITGRAIRKRVQKIRQREKEE